MAASTSFVCQQCGSVFAKWSGKCDGCNAWNTLVEEVTGGPPIGAGAALPKPSTRKRARGVEFVALSGVATPPPRISTGILELDRVLGGGIVAGSAILVGGDPGIGKSTLLLQAAARMADLGAKVAYVSGEESTAQVQDRARRLGHDTSPVQLGAETALASILEGLKSTRPDVAVIDSIQTLWTDALPAAPGSVVQVRACAQELVRFAKSSGTALIFVGHVTKDGQIAGPRVVEHLVDAVLYFEGERAHMYRILRGVKNRFGATDEIGVFEMGEAGLAEVANPSALFLGPEGEPASGSVVFAGLEGARPLLVEIQALVAPAAFGTPRRAVVGLDSGRLAMVLAVLEARCGVSLSGRDVYLNTSGGLKIHEPAADLAMAAALVSASADRPLARDTVVFGEISLSGDVRAVGRPQVRLREAAKLGFRGALAPAGASASGGSGLDQVTCMTRVSDLVAWFSDE